MTTSITLRTPIPKVNTTTQRNGGDRPVRNFIVSETLISRTIKSIIDLNTLKENNGQHDIALVIMMLWRSYNVSTIFYIMLVSGTP